MAGTLIDFLRSHETAEVLCPRQGEVMRRLTKLPDGRVRIEAANGEAMDLPGDTKLVYQPWALDRGSLLFNERYKLCTEFDRVRYPNGTERLAESTDCGEVQDQSGW